MRPVTGRSFTSCSVVRPGPVPRDTQARNVRPVTTAGPDAGAGLAWAARPPPAATAAPAAAAAAPFFKRRRRESPSGTLMVGSFTGSDAVVQAIRARFASGRSLRLRHRPRIGSGQRFGRLGPAGGVVAGGGFGSARVRSRGWRGPAPRHQPGRDDSNRARPRARRRPAPLRRVPLRRYTARPAGQGVRRARLARSTSSHDHPGCIPHLTVATERRGTCRT